MNANQSHNYLTYVRMAITIREEMTSVGGNVDKIEHLYTVGGSAIGSTTLENNREIPQTIKNGTTTRSSNYTSDNIFKGHENKLSERYMHSQVLFQH